MQYIELVLANNSIETDCLLFGKIKDGYTNSREMLTAKILKGVMKNGKMPLYKSIENDLANVEIYNIKMFEAMEEVHDALFKSMGKKNLAYKCKVVASNESYYESKHYPCLRVVDVNASKELYWTSNAEDEIHWLTFDLLSPVVIKKFKLFHDYVPMYVLVDYTIQSSNNALCWENIAMNKGNKSNVTEHVSCNVPYRYYRLYITKPSWDDNAARLHQFEAWA